MLRIRTMEYGQRLCEDRTFAQQALPFLAPYVLYVVLPDLLPAMLGQVWPQAIKLVAVAVTLIMFGRTYRFGALRPMHLLAALLATPVALALWVGPVYALRAAGIGGSLAVVSVESPLYFILRLINSVALVAVFEELLLRVYLTELTYQASLRQSGRNLLNALLTTVDTHPTSTPGLPLNLTSVLLTTVLFSIGHAPVEYLSAALYFLFTTWLYAQTGSLWACIIIHALTNLMLAGLVRFAGLTFLWFG